ncbi:MAG: NAD(P)-binding protein [Bacteriovorax sp.]|nr:NAD(P)-binding protein [Bacteriovorax sp.]
MIKDYIIIGAGLSGLNTARKIKEIGLGSVLILEKSRGIGGRMATRRTLETRFDHGAQFYRVKSDISELHEWWKVKNISHRWFVSFKGDHWCSDQGMTALAKSIVDGLEIALEKQIHTIRYDNNIWKLVSDKNEEWECRNLIISAPLPQALLILERSSLKQIDLQEIAELKKIQYTKALIGLLILEQDILINEFGYEEFQSGDFFSITDQKMKGVSKISAITITMSPTFSESEFDNADDVVMTKILKIFKEKYPMAMITGSELKKWRYCQPLSKYKSFYFEVAPKLYLIGDAFGGASLLGAVRSSEALCDYIF